MTAYGRAANVYRTVQVESARPATVLDDLYARALEDCRGAAAAIAAGDPGTKGRLLGHALKIVGELSASLDHGLAPDVCKNLAGLYGFVSNRLCRANAEMDARPIAEAERIIASLRDSFQQAAAR